MEDVGCTLQTVVSGERRDCTIVELLDPFDWAVKPVAAADGKE